MCGIAGIAWSEKSGRSADRGVLVRMTDRIAHRGPDDAGVFVDGNVGLGHRRLTIVDLKTGGQPMSNSDGSLVIVYNGEVYNHIDHREDLIERGYRYASTSDTETILHLYQEFGSDCVHRLRGMFAFVIWDRNKRELFLARDRFGVKPLYYVLTQDGSIFFASEIKSLLETGVVKPELNYSALPDQLANRGTSGDETLFMGIKRLLPGHFLKWKDGKIEITRFWDLEFEPKEESLTESEAVEEWLALFRHSVRLRLMSDVPLGMFLSGGIDSSAIAAVMSETAGEPIKTFSVGFKEREANEFRYARMVAKRFGTDHHEITITPAEFFAELPKLVWHEDEPLGFEASVPLYFVSKLASRHVKVVLTGEGSDETLAGYGRYRKAALLLDFGERYESIVPTFVRNAVRSGVNSLPSAIGKKLGRTFLTRNADLNEIFFDNFAVFGKSMQAELFTDEAKSRISDIDPFAGTRHWLADKSITSVLDKMLYVDTKAYLHELLMKQDQMSMAASIESRVPFLDHKLVEFSARLPDAFKLRGKTTKWILRKAMKGVLPEEILTRSKMGFPVPLGQWFRGEFKHIVDDLVLDERAMARGLFNADLVTKMVGRHEAGEDHASRIWALLNLEIWHRRFIDGEDE
ncbi:MAG TPA: asparagine synthase (glutamine-hydrolyzing) [Pyrinomonadaceae bacterium]|nr:asparagine synthase (glutamine-hydrolyzing) [Pyrinomonadaceae bacterium]